MFGWLYLHSILERIGGRSCTKTWMVFSIISIAKGTGSFKLNQFVAQHRNAFVTMQQCSEHVKCQLPNELSRVKYLLKGIECGNLMLQASIALVKNDD
eukprot:10569058-Ditylum_brightwellii.AAC.1